MDDIIKERRAKVIKVISGYSDMKMVEKTESAFANDLLVFTRNEKAVKHNLEVWCKARRK